MHTITKKIFLFIVFTFLFFFLNQKTVVFARDWESYIQNGAYVVNGVACGRVGEDDSRYTLYDYTQVDDCWNSRCSRGMCKGEIPLCCYKLEEEGNAKACAWPERAYCLPKQCDEISGDNLKCGHSIGYWCNKDCGMKSDASDIPYISFEQRFSGSSSPTSTPTTTKPTRTPTPRPTTSSSKISSTTNPTKTKIPTSSVKIPTLTSAPTTEPIHSFSIPTIGSTTGISPTPTPKSAISFDFGSALEKIKLSDSFKNDTKNFILSSNKILDLPKVIFESITLLDKKLETNINSLFLKALDR